MRVAHFPSADRWNQTPSTKHQSPRSKRNACPVYCVFAVDLLEHCWVCALWDVRVFLTCVLPPTCNTDGAFPQATSAQGSCTSWHLASAPQGTPVTSKSGEQTSRPHRGRALRGRFRLGGVARLIPARCTCQTWRGDGRRRSNGHSGAAEWGGKGRVGMEVPTTTRIPLPLKTVEVAVATSATVRNLCMR